MKYLKTFDQFLDQKLNENEDGLSKPAHLALGLKQVRIVISGPGQLIEENSDKILNFIKKADPDSKCDFYPKTGKIVGTFAKARIDNIKRDLRSIDPRIKIEIKKQNLIAFD